MISLIATVLNEGDNIRHLLESIMRQTRPPAEIVIVDGGSTDDTAAIIRGYRDELPLRLLVQAGCNISQGRNHAITAAAGDIIAVTDAGVRLSDDWLEKITDPLLAQPRLNVVGGFFRADPQSPFEIALGATTLPLATEINAESFLPSSRSIAFRKRAALRAGLYPDWLDFCEDLIFDLRLRRVAGPFAFAPDALVHFRPRTTLRKYFRPILSLRPRRWQSQPLVQTPSHPLPRLPGSPSHYPHCWRVDSSFALGALSGRRRHLSAGTIPALEDPDPEGWRRVIGALALCHHRHTLAPLPWRSRQDDRLSNRLALASQASSAVLARRLSRPSALIGLCH